MTFFPVDTAMAFLTEQPLHPADNAEVMKSQTDPTGEAGKRLLVSAR